MSRRSRGSDIASPPLFDYEVMTLDETRKYLGSVVNEVELVLEHLKRGLTALDGIPESDMKFHVKLVQPKTLHSGVELTIKI